MSPMQSVNLIIHGLFFISQNSDRGLDLIAPAVDNSSSTLPHNLLYGVRGNLQRPASKIIPWNNIGLEGGTSPTFTPGKIPEDVGTTILQISIKSLGLGGWKSDLSYYAGIFKLPWPQLFFSVRCDDLDRSFPNNGGFVAQEIDGRCRDEEGKGYVGLATGLRYGYTDDTDIRAWFPGWSDGNSIHCYFEPCQKHYSCDVNNDLHQAALCFKNSGNFDLRIGQSADAYRSPRGENSPNAPSDLGPDDDMSLTEDPEAVRQKICPSPSGERTEAKQFGPVNENLNPANCPNMFVGP